MIKPSLSLMLSQTGSVPCVLLQLQHNFHFNVPAQPKYRMPSGSGDVVIHTNWLRQLAGSGMCMPGHVQACRSAFHTHAMMAAQVTKEARAGCTSGV